MARKTKRSGRQLSDLALSAVSGQSGAVPKTARPPASVIAAMTAPVKPSKLDGKPEDIDAYDPWLVDGPVLDEDRASVPGGDVAPSFIEVEASAPSQAEGSPQVDPEVRADKSVIDDDRALDVEKGRGTSEYIAGAMAAFRADDYVEVFQTEPAHFTVDEVNALLAWGAENEVSDLFVYSGFRVRAQQQGRLLTLTRRRLETPELFSIIGKMRASAESTLLSGHDVDMTYDFNPERGKHYSFRVCATRCREPEGGANAIEIVFRTIPSAIPTPSDLGVEAALLKNAFPKDGVVLVTGPTGSGKSTLLAAILHQLLIDQDARLLTYEAPPEFPLVGLRNVRGMVSQCEIGLHIGSFAAGVRNALRRKPDYILIGESRDRETIEMCVRAGETGHGVYTTVHTRGVLNAIDRMADEFPVDVRWSVKVKLIDAMRLVIHQRLVRGADGKRFALREWLPFSEEFRERLLMGGESNYSALMQAELAANGQSLSVSADKAMALGHISPIEAAKVRGSDPRGL